jgi:GH18 family chitinase
MGKYPKATYPLSLFCLFAILATNLDGASVFYCSFRSAAYYPEYYSEQFPISQIRYDKLTDIVYFSIYPNSDGSLNTSEINLTLQQGLIHTAHLNNVKVSICVGGWNLSANFSPVAANPAIRTTFINNLVQFCLNCGLDGIDLDWEPVWDPADKINYTIMIQELKTAMAPHALTLSVAVAAQGSEFGSAAFGSIDWLHVMAYDMGTPHSSYDAALAALLHWESFGFSRAKIVLGLPFYGRYGSSWDLYPYKDIVNQYAPEPGVDEVAGINFNGINTIKAKTSYVLENGYGGVMFWELTNDSIDQTSLLTAITETVHQKRPPDFNCDETIDILDLNHLITYWLTAGCTADNMWCQRGDLNFSAKVDLSDIALFSQEWIGQ